MASISKCRACGSKKLTEIFSLGEQYLSAFVELDGLKPEKHPLDIVLCGECTLLQLKSTVSSGKLYGSDYGYYSGISNTIRDDLEDVVAKACERVILDVDDIVVDIGSNDGTLLKKHSPHAIRVGFDLVKKFKKFYDEDNLRLVSEGFSYEKFNELYPNKKAKIITAISMFYDLDEPNKFVEDLAKTLHPEGIIVIQQNYLVGMLQQNAFDNIVHEHLEYYSLTSLTKLLNKHGLDVVEVSVSDINGGSFRVYVKHMEVLKQMRLLESKMKLDNKWTYISFGMRINQARKHLYNFIEQEVAKGKTVYAYGASTRGNTLMQFTGLNNTLIKYAVERNPDKFGKKIASLDIPIISEKQARKEKPDYFLVLPWFFREEICKREEEYVMNGGALIFPLPELYVYDKDKCSNAKRKEQSPSNS